VPDNLILTGISGTSLNLGSWLRPYDKPDYGAKGLLQAVISENTTADGGALAYEHLGARHMTIPLILPSAGVFGGLSSLEAMLRLCARPGAVLDIQPEGMSDAVRFDVIHGRYEEEYDTYENRVMRRRANIVLDTQPLGYLPTSILVASTASVGLPGTIDLSGVSFIGDAPGLAELVVQPTAPTSFTVASHVPDAVLWSLGARASSQNFWPAGSTVAGDLTSSFSAQTLAPAATSRVVFLPQNQTSMLVGAQVVIPTALEPAYRGRWRAFAYFSVGGIGGSATALVSMDAVATHNSLAPLASAAVVGALSDATAIPFPLVDLGELTIPPTGSGLTQSVLLRVWCGLSATSGGASSGVILNGLYFHSLDGANGVLPRGLSPARASGLAKDSPGQFVAQAYERRVMVAQTQTDLSVHAPRVDLTGDHRGGYPLVSGQASTVKLDLVVGTRRSTGTSLPSHSAPLAAAASLSYRPRFYFLHGL
jgi:hypothetical protein